MSEVRMTRYIYDLFKRWTAERVELALTKRLDGRAFLSWTHRHFSTMRAIRDQKLLLFCGSITWNLAQLWYLDGRSKTLLYIDCWLETPLNFDNSRAKSRFCPQTAKKLVFPSSNSTEKKKRWTSNDWSLCSRSVTSGSALWSKNSTVYFESQI